MRLSADRTPLDLTSLHQDPYYRRFRAEICAMVRRKRDEQLAEIEAELEATTRRVGCEEAQREREEEQPEYQQSRAA